MKTSKTILLKSILFAACFGVFTLNSCEEKTNDPIIDEPLNTPPTIVFTEPSQGLYGPIGVHIPIIADITDDHEISKLYLSITNSVNQDSIIMIFDGINDKNHSLDTGFIANAPAGSHTNFTIKLNATDNQNLTFTSYKYVHVMD